MLPYSATDVLRVMEYELTPEPARQLGTHIARDVVADRDDDDRDRDGGIGGQLIRLIVFRNPAPSAA